MSSNAPARATTAPGSDGLAVSPDPSAPVTEPAPDSPAAAAAMVAPTQDDHRATRGRRLRFALLTSVVSRPLSVLIQFISLPLFIKYLGPEGYGLYESVAALAMWLALSNMGLSLGLQNRLQDCYVSGDRALARRYVSSLTIALVAIAIVGVLVLSVVTPLVDWSRVFPTVTPRPPGETAWAVWMAAMLTLVGLAISAPYVAYAAYQELHVANLWDGLAKVLTLGACLGVVWTRLGLVGVILASTGTLVAVRIVNAIWFFGWEKPWLRPSLRAFDAGLLRVALTEGVYLFGLQMATGLTFQVDKLIIGSRLGAADVTAYAVVGRLFLLVHAGLMLVQMPLWPAYGEAIRRGDISWARRVLRLMLLVSTASMLAWGAVLCFAGGPIVRFVTHGEHVAVPKGLIVAVTTFFVARVWAECHSVPLNAAGVIKPQVRALLSNGVLNVLLALLLVKPFGVLGVAWAFPITALATTVWAYPVLVRRHLSERAAAAGSTGAADAAGSDATALTTEVA